MEEVFVIRVIERVDFFDILKKVLEIGIFKKLINNIIEKWVKKWFIEKEYK